MGVCVSPSGEEGVSYLSGPRSNTPGVVTLRPAWPLTSEMFYSVTRHKTSLEETNGHDFEENLSENDDNSLARHKTQYTMVIIYR